MGTTTAKSALDAIVLSLSGLNDRLSGDDSGLRNPWEEIKYQLQHQPSFFWPAYLDTIKQSVATVVRDLAPDGLSELSASLKCSGAANVELELIRRLLLRGKKEKIRYSPFDFKYFCYTLMDFTVYAQVIERTGTLECTARGFSIAAPYGEEGAVDMSGIIVILSEEQFDAARNAGWPTSWTSSA